MEECYTITLIKNWLYLPAFLIAIGFPELLSWGISSLTFLMILDTLTGIIASGRIDGIKEITSRKMVGGIVAKSLILIIPFLFVFVARTLNVDLFKYIRGIVALLVLAESYSIIGNIYSAKNQERLPEVDFISLILKRLRETIISILDRNKI
jgi:toxin secretion/phage lysis holin